MTSDEQAIIIERDRQRKEDELLLLLLLLSDDLRREIRNDFRDGFETQYLTTHLDRFSVRAAREISLAMAQAHSTAFMRAGKLTGQDIGRVDAGSIADLAKQYQPQADDAAQAMADSIRESLAQTRADVAQAQAAERVGVATTEQESLAKLGINRVIKLSFDRAGYTAAHPQNLDAGVERAIVSASNVGMFSAIDSLPIGEQEVGIRHHTILDGRETDICRDRANLTLRASHPYWRHSGGIPQLHWRCRSTLLPVMPPYTESDWLPTVPPMPGFGFGPLPAFARSAVV